MVMNVKGVAPLESGSSLLISQLDAFFSIPPISQRRSAQMRYFKSVEQSIVENIEFELRQDIGVAVPNTASVAKAWASHLPAKATEPPIVNLTRLLR